MKNKMFLMIIVISIIAIGCKGTDSMPEVDDPPEINKVSSPIAIPAEGTYYDVLEISFTCPTPDVFIIYTLDGSDPSETRGTLFTAPFEILASTTIKVFAFKDGFDSSDILILNYTLNLNQVPTPVLSTSSLFTTGNEVLKSEEITLTCLDPEASIYYVLGNGTLSINPLTEYSGSFTVDAATKVKAVAIRRGYDSSETLEADLAISVLTPRISDSGQDNYPIPYVVSIVPEYDVGAFGGESNIYYSLDGSYPSIFAGNTGAILPEIVLTKSETVRIIEVHPDYDSVVVEAYFELIPQAPRPTFSISGGEWLSDNIAMQGDMEINISEPGFDIYYTTDGSSPSPTNGIRYTGSIDLDDTVGYYIYCAKAYKDGYYPSFTGILALRVID